MAVWSVLKLGTGLLEILDCFGQSRDSFQTVIDPFVLYVCYIVVLAVVRPEMAMDFGSKEVESRLMKGLSMDSPRTVFGDELYGKYYVNALNLMCKHDV